MGLIDRKWNKNFVYFLRCLRNISISALLIPTTFSGVSLTAFSSEAKPLSGDRENSETKVLIVSSSESFDPKLDVLRFPDKDANRFSNVMKKTGRVLSNDMIELRDGSVQEFRQSISEISKMFRLNRVEKQINSKFIFYFTGHSDTKGLHFFDGLISKKELHSLLNSVPAKKKIIFLDSCFSGGLAMTQVEIAEMMNVSRRTVQRLKERAEEKLLKIREKMK